MNEESADVSLVQHQCFSHATPFAVFSGASEPLLPFFLSYAHPFLQPPSHLQTQTNSTIRTTNYLEAKHDGDSKATKAIRRALLRQTRRRPASDPRFRRTHTGGHAQVQFQRVGISCKHLLIRCSTGALLTCSFLTA